MFHFALYAAESQSQDPIYDFFEQHYILEFNLEDLRDLPNNPCTAARATVILEYDDQTQKVINNTNVLLFIKQTSLD